ncbi:MSF1-domain-containing protein, partial [Clavulina sp. PMI_390]
VKFFAQTHTYDEPWQTVTLAFFLRYPNPYATHVLSADVISRSFTPRGTLVTTRLILKKGPMPKWLPRSVVGRAESWIVEESEVDPLGKVVKCETRNVDHVRVLSVRESVELKEGGAASTIQRTEAKLVSQLGWLARRAERYGHEKFQRNLERSRAGLHLVVDLLRQSREQALAL